MAASEYLPGANLTWMGAFDRGRLLAAGTRERLEYVLPHVAPSGVTGAPAVTRTLERADVAATGQAAVRALDPEPHGAYFVDLKEDASGRPRVTEVNAGRCGTTIEFYSAAGCNFPWLLVQLAAGQHPAPLPDPDRAVESGLYWVRTLDCGPVLVRGEEGFSGFPSAGPVRR
jgi:carbamoyl-phosphate synthase large subunit